MKRTNNEPDQTIQRRPPPRPSRTKACTECRRHKIKCEYNQSESSCTKCLRSGIDCIPHDLNHRFQEEDALWKAQMKTEIYQMQAAIQQLLRHNQMPELSAYSTASVVPSPTDPASAVVVPPMDMTRDNSPQPQSRDDTGLVPAPMSSLYDLTRIKNLRSYVLLKPNANMMDDDFISQGIISIEDAQHLFAHYMQNSNQLLWGGILFPHQDLNSVRRSSSMLAAAILTVAALHMPERDELLQRCYSSFVSLVSNTCLSRHHTLDDIRALCLGAFYISNLSWKLSGQAVRLATEMNLHQSFHKLCRGEGAQRECVRLWYALYVCEHHFSIAYGRPPIIGEDLAVRNVEKFVEQQDAVPGDIRICAQVALFKILTEAFYEFGSDQKQKLGEHDFERLRFFNLAIEQWRLTWQPRSADSDRIGSYPSKGVILFYHFARFQLNSLALRAIVEPNAAFFEPLSYDRREAANIAISAASSTLTLVLEEDDLRQALPGVPIFTHAMIAFCSTFLLKMAIKWSSSASLMPEDWNSDTSSLGLNFNNSQVILLIRQSTDMLADISGNLNEKHLTRHIVSGIRYLLKGFGTVSDTISDQVAPCFYDSATGQPFLPHISPSMNEPRNLNGNYNFYDLVGSYGFGFDESYLGQVAAQDPDLWSYP